MGPNNSTSRSLRTYWIMIISRLFKFIYRIHLTSDAEIPNDDKATLGRLLQTRWAMLHSPLHDAGFLLNPAYRLNESWKDEAVVSGTTNLLKKWNHAFFYGKLDVDRDFPVELSRYIDMVRINKFAESITKPQTIPNMLETWNVPLDQRSIPAAGSADVARDSHMFWQAYGGSMPMLRDLALIVFKQPISQSAAEQSLSSYKHIMTEQRVRLLPTGCPT